MIRHLPFLLALASCSTAAPTSSPEAGHGHDHTTGHDHAAAHGEGHAHEHDGAARRAALGALTVSLDPAASSLSATLTDPSGAKVTPAEELRVVLTGTGQEPQRVVLARSGEAYRGDATAVGAPGYTAVVSASLDGRTESARITWGEVPKPASHDHEDGGHDHGSSGHDHGSGGHVH